MSVEELKLVILSADFLLNFVGTVIIRLSSSFELSLAELLSLLLIENGSSPHPLGRAGLVPPLLQGVCQGASNQETAHLHDCCHPYTLSAFEPCRCAKSCEAPSGAVQFEFADCNFGRVIQVSACQADGVSLQGFE